MRKEYMVPQTEVMQFGSILMQDAVIGVVQHSGGKGSDGSSGFTDENIIY